MNKWCHLNLLGDVTNVPNLSAWLSQAATERKDLDLPKSKHLFNPETFEKTSQVTLKTYLTYICSSILGQPKDSPTSVFFTHHILIYPSYTNIPKPCGSQFFGAQDKTIPPEVKPEQLHVLTIVDFTKLGVATTGVINKQLTLLQKVLQRNPGCV